MIDDGIKKILLAGEGGQGVQVVAEILTLAAKEQNEETSYIPNFGVEQRNGVSIAFVEIGGDEISYPKFSTADILVAMCDRSVEAITEFAGDQTVVIYDGSNIKDTLLKPLRQNSSPHELFNIPARQIANEKLIAKVANVILLGAILAKSPEINQDIVRRIMNEKFKKYTDKNPDLGRMNNEAFELGLKLGIETQPSEYKGSEPKEIKKLYENDTKSWERFPELCKSCGMCIEKCPNKIIYWSKDLNERGTPLPEVDIDGCTACQTCQRTCPEGALRVEKK